MRLAPIVVALSLGLVVTPRAVLAQPSSGSALVAIVTTDPSASLPRRVRAELQALGLDVIVIKPPAEASASREPLEQAARNVGALAAVRLVSSGTGKVEVWVADRVTGKALVRELVATEGASSDAAVALGAVELLRASLMELHAPDPPRGEVAPTAAARALALPVTTPAGPPRIGVAAGIGVDVAGGASPAPLATLAVWGRVAGGLGVRVTAQSPLSAAHSAGASGSVDVQAQRAGLALSYELTDPAGAWVPTVQAGCALAHVTASGAAQAPYVGTTEDTWTAMPFVGAGLGWAFVRGLRLRLDATVGWSAPAVEIHTPEGSTRWGTPLVSTVLGLEVLWAPAP